MARRILNITDEDKAEMLRLYVAENLGVVDIGKRFGVSAATVARFIKASGGVMRKRGTRTTKPAVDNFAGHIPEVVEVEEPQHLFHHPVAG